MAKNSIFDPTKDGVKADNSGYSSNQIDKMIGESAAALIDDDASGDDTVYSSAKIYSMLPEDTATGSSVTITDACPDVPIVELQADINAVQEGTGDPSPDNVRPISGWDEITVTHDGIDIEISLGDNTVYGGIYNSDGTLTVTHYCIDSDAIETLYLDSQTETVAVFRFRLDNNNFPEAVASTAISDHFSRNIAAGNQGRMVQQANLIYFVLAKASLETIDAAGAIAWLSDNPTKFVYELATPIELTVGTLAFNTNGEGTTIISCDSGDVTVKYKKLTTLS